MWFPISIVILLMLLVYFYTNKSNFEFPNLSWIPQTTIQQLSKINIRFDVNKSMYDNIKHWDVYFTRDRFIKHEYRVLNNIVYLDENSKINKVFDVDDDVNSVTIKYKHKNGNVYDVGKYTVPPRSDDTSGITCGITTDIFQVLNPKCKNSYKPTDFMNNYMYWWGTRWRLNMDFLQNTEECNVIYSENDKINAAINQHDDINVDDNDLNNYCPGLKKSERYLGPYGSPEQIATSHLPQLLSPCCYLLTGKC